MFSVLCTCGFSQVIPLDEQTFQERSSRLEPYMEDSRALEIRYTTTITEDSTIIQNGNSYQLFSSTREALLAFENELKKSDYTIYYVIGAGVTEVYELRRKVLRKQFYHRQELPREISETVQIK